MTANGDLVRDGIRYELIGNVMIVHLDKLNVKYGVDLPAKIDNVQDAVAWYQDQISKTKREVLLRPEKDQ